MLSCSSFNPHMSRAPAHRKMRLGYRLTVVGRNHIFLPNQSRAKSSIPSGEEDASRLPRSPESWVFEIVVGNQAINGL